MNNEKIQKEGESSFRHILKYTGIFGMVQVLNMLMNIIRNKVAAVFLGRAGMGMLDMYNKSTNLLSQSTNFGISISGVKQMSEVASEQEAERIRHYATTLRTYSLMVGLFGMCVCILCHWFLHESYTTVNFFLLSPIILMMAVNEGELAILKGTKQLMRLTTVSVLTAFIILLVFTPFFYFLHSKGIIWALLLSHVIIGLTTLHFSTKRLPYRVDLLSKETLRTGLPMLRMGIGLLIAGFLGKGSEFLVNYFIEQNSGLDDVGLFNRGYTMAVVYAAIIFSAMDADYYPRLSATEKNIPLQNITINRQIEVCVLLISPFLVFFTIGLPIIVPILFSQDFVECIPMTIGAIFFMFFRALCLPVSYLALARSDSKMYMLTELIYDAMIAVLIPVAYHKWGLGATGFTISFCGFVSLILYYILYRWRYGFRFDTKHLGIYVIQAVLLAGAVWLAFEATGWMRWVTGGLLGLLSLVISMRILSKETDIFTRLKAKFKK